MNLEKTILVTGSNGQLGQELFKAVQNIDDLNLVFTDVEQFDITRTRQVRTVIESLKPFAVVNCAAYTAVDRAEAEPELAAAINVAGPGNLAVACALTGSLLIHISTDYVFGGDASEPYREDHPVNPKGVYAETKAQGEQAVITSGADYAIVRTSWLYSTFGHNFVKTMLKLGSEKDELNVVSDQTGSPTNAQDLALAVLQIIRHPSADKTMREIFHYANTGSVSWFEFASEIINYAKLNCKVNPIPTSGYPTPAPRPAYSVLDTAKIRNALNIRIPGWKESLHSCLDLLLNSQQH